MLRFAIKRLLGAIPTLLVLLALAFVLIRVAPGGPFDSERQLPPEIQERLNAAYHLDEPLWQQLLCPRIYNRSPKSRRLPAARGGARA